MYIFFKFIIFHFFPHVSGSNFESLKKRVTLEEMKHFYYHFLGEHLGFFISSCFSFFLFSFLLLLISWCFHFFMFLILQIFLLLTVFVHYNVLSGTSFLCCYREYYGFERAFLPIFGTICFYQGLSGARTLALKVAGISTEVWNTDSTHLFESQSVRQLYDK